MEGNLTRFNQGQEVFGTFLYISCGFRPILVPETAHWPSRSDESNPLEEPAQVRLVNNHVCITAPASAGGKIFSVQIGNDFGQEIYKTFGLFSQQQPVIKDECLPTFGIDFKPGNTYAVFYHIEKNSTVPGMTYAVRFSLEQNEKDSCMVEMDDQES